MMQRVSDAASEGWCAGFKGCCAGFKGPSDLLSKIQNLSATEEPEVRGSSAHTHTVPPTAVDAASLLRRCCEICFVMSCEMSNPLECEPGVRPSTASPDMSPSLLLLLTGCTICCTDYLSM